MAIRQACDHVMLASFLALTVLGIGLVIFWIAWWLMADLFGGSSPATPARITAAHEDWHPSGPPRRPAIGH